MEGESRRLRRSSVAHSAASRIWHGAGPAAAAARTSLAPAELLFRLATGARNALYDRGALASAGLDVPVVSVGNLAVGGTGKTPFTRYVVERLLARGAKPAILHGGYGDDEPALHAIWQPTVPVLSGRDRLEAGRRAVAAGANVAVLDDGFQHRRLRRNLDIVLIAAESLARPVHVLPRGPWREPLSALKRADLVVVTRRTASEPESRAALEAVRRCTAAPAVRAWLRADGWRDRTGPAGPPADAAFAVTAIADPGAFLSNARNAGAVVEDGIAFPDHHVFTAEDVARIRAEAGGRTLVLTEKDAVKLEPLLPETEMRVLLQRVEIEEGGADLERALDALA